MKSRKDLDEEKKELESQIRQNYFKIVAQLFTATVLGIALYQNTTAFLSYQPPKTPRNDNKVLVTSYSSVDDISLEGEKVEPGIRHILNGVSPEEAESIGLWKEALYPHLNLGINPEINGEIVVFGYLTDNPELVLQDILDRAEMEYNLPRDGRIYVSRPEIWDTVLNDPENPSLKDKVEVYRFSGVSKFEAKLLQNSLEALNYENVEFVQAPGKNCSYDLIVINPDIEKLATNVLLDTIEGTNLKPTYDI